MRNWRKNNPEKMQQYKEKYKEYHRNWRKNNTDKMKKYAAKRKQNKK